MPLRPLLASALLLPLAGCIVVVDREVHTRWSDADRPVRGQIGVSIDEVQTATAAQLNIDRDRSTLVTYVVPGSPAEKAGLRRYDIITAVDGSDRASPASLREAIRQSEKGRELRLSVIREGRPEIVTVVTE